MIKIQDLNGNLLKVDKKSCKNINISYIGCVTKKDSKYVNIHSVNPLYFIVNKVHVFIEEREGNKYVNFASTVNSKEVLEKYIELWDGIKNLIKK